MNKVSNVKLSLRKLLTAMMAVGPLAILPAPVWATLPTSSSFTVQNGTASVSTSGSQSTIATSDRAVLQWGSGNFTIAAGEGYNFQMPAGGAVLNRVGNSTATDTATINGQLDSNGKVFILANGTISVGSGASITTSGGLFLSALPEENGAFLATGDLLYIASSTAAQNGTINIGTSGNATSVSVSGNLTAVGGTINHYGSSVTGDMVLRAVNSSSPITLVNVAGGVMSVGGNLSVTTNASAITQGATGGAITVGNTTALSQTATFNTTGGNVAVTLNNAANDFQVVTVNAPGTGGNVTINDANIIRLNASTIGQDLSVTATGNSTLSGTAIGTNGALTVGGNATFNTTNDNSSVSIGANSTIGGMLAGTITNNGSFTFNGTGNLTTGAISSTNGTSGGNRTGVTITTTGIVTINGTISALGNNATAGGSVSITGNSITVNTTTNPTITAGNASRAGGIAMNATAGNLTIGNLDSYNRVSLVSTGNINQATGTSIITRNNSASVTNIVNAGGTAVLDNSGNNFAASQITQFTGGTINLTNGNATNNLTTNATLVVGTTNVTGNLNLVSAGGIMLGTGSGTAGQSITVGGVLSANVTGATNQINDNDYSAFNVFGGLTLVTNGGSVTLDAASKNGSLAPSVRYGVVNVNTGTGAAITLSETTSLNLGTVTGTTLTANSTTGGILDTGNITVTTANLVANGNNTIVLDSTNNIANLNIAGSNQATVNVTAGAGVVLGGSAGSLTGNLTVNTGSGQTLTVNGVSVTGGLTLNAGSTTTFATGNSSVTGDLVLNSAGAVTQAAGIGVTVTGNTTINNSGAVTLTGANDFNSVILANSADVSVSDINNLTVSGTTTGNLTATAGATGGIANTWNLVLGNLSVNQLTATASNGGGGNSGTITQATGTSVHAESDTTFTTTNNNIVVANAGNSFGKVQIFVNSTDGSRTVTVTEDGTLRLGNLTNRGTTTLTSRTGSIIEDPGATSTFTNNGTLVLNAVAGSVLIGNTTKSTGFNTTGNVVTANINAPTGAAAVFSSSNLTLGTTTVASLTANATGGNLTQSGTLKVFGSANFSASGNIALDRAGNNFGRVSLTTTGVARNITIVEDGTLNLGTVSMPASSTGNFTATSTNGDIIDTGLANLRPGGTTASPGSGVVTLTALNGNIVLDDPTTDIPTTGGVVFNAKDVTLSPLGNAAIYLGATGTTSVATGNLVVTSAIGNIASNGNISVTGDAFFQAGNGNITLAQSGNKFGTVKFTGNQVAIVESDDMAIVTGSSAIGSSQLSSGGSLSVVNKGGTINFNNTVFLSATGNITLPKVVQAVGTITVNAAGTKDLSVLSKSGDLNNKDPNNLGTGTYLPPLP